MNKWVNKKVATAKEFCYRWPVEGIVGMIIGIILLILAWRFK